MYILSLWRPLLEIIVLSILFYYLIVFFSGTPVTSAFRLLIFLFIGFFLAQKLQLHTINWVLTKLFAILIIALLIIFQPELRRALVHLGEGPFFGFGGMGIKSIIDEITEAIIIMSKRKIGALIAIEREIGLKNYIETGVKLNAVISSEMLTTIFMPNTPLHDGGVVIQEDLIAGAACTFPLSQSLSLDRIMGTRHQAGLGITEETDAMVFIVSEETGTVSFAYKGKLSRGIDEDGIRHILANIYKVSRKKRLERIWKK